MGTHPFGKRMLINKILQYVESQPYSAFYYSPPKQGNDIAFSYLFKSPSKVLRPSDYNSVTQLLNEVDELIRAGHEGISVLPYELGYLFEDKFSQLIKQRDVAESINDNLLFCFYSKDQIEIINSNEIEFDYSNENEIKIKSFSLSSTERKYKENIARIKSYIEEGDTYQVNYTVKGNFKFSGKTSDLFMNLIFNQSAEFSAFINLGDKHILSVSPELFFKIENVRMDSFGGKLTTRPMKGTIRRGFSIDSDSLNRKTLIDSDKEKAENVMIVDLLRNDLGRIGNIGSVKVNSLFNIEKYESVFQMTSTIETEIDSTLSFTHILRNIFPCGSITGAPKIRTMEIIREIEKKNRGIYTGSIGLILKDKKVFNVAIRTPIIDVKSGRGEVGLGGGIVWDSESQSEFYEVKLKGKFLTEPEPYFELFESMLVTHCKINLLERHLNRLKNAAEHFLFVYNEDKIIGSIDNAIKHLNHGNNYKLKLSLSKCGINEIQIGEIQPHTGKVIVRVSNRKINSKNKFQFFKTTNRHLYDKTISLKKNKNIFDVIFFNDKDELCEGTRTNIFIKKDDVFYTPIIECGILNGVQREIFAKEISAIEGVLFLNDLINADEVYLSNAVRGITKVDILSFNEEKIYYPPLSKL